MWNINRVGNEAKDDASNLKPCKLCDDDDDDILPVDDPVGIETCWCVLF